jgi:hypothetical protein
MIATLLLCKANTKKLEVQLLLTCACVLAARILIVNFVVCTLAAKRKKKIRAGIDMSDRTIPL